MSQLYCGGEADLSGDLQRSNLKQLVVGEETSFQPGERNLSARELL